MAELKNTFTAGKMNKDLDERIIPSTEYREALNIGVATSEDSDVGAAQNILGNLRLSCVIQGPADKYLDKSKHITAIADPLTDMIYRFVHTPNASDVWMDRIIEFDTTKDLRDPCESKEKAVLIDVYKVVSNATGSSEACAGGDTILELDKNVFQIRHGMLVTGGGITDEVYVKSVEINGSSQASVTLSKNLTLQFVGVELTFEFDRVLNFSPDRYITGINVLDGMIFWTDNYSEPKKINIERSKMGSVVSNTNALLDYPLQNFDQHTKLVVNELIPTVCVKESPSGCGEAVVTGKVYGCMSPNAFNYNPLANSNLECCYDEGCTDPAYLEFDPLACHSNPSMCITLQPCNDPRWINLPPGGILGAPQYSFRRYDYLDRCAVQSGSTADLGNFPVSFHDDPITNPFQNGLWYYDNVNGVNYCNCAPPNYTSSSTFGILPAFPII